ncbi:MAG: hypothetical protein FWD05_12140 [Oscillospiraceae bacterium]|nr:hypothetical protein [Oscillospiraceae bacterium]
MKTNNNIQRQTKFIKYGIIVTVTGLLVTILAVNYLGRRELLAAIEFMDNFQHVDRIEINSVLGNYRISEDDSSFEELNNLLYPFNDGRVIVSAGTRRMLQRQSHEQFAEIYFYANGKLLFSLNVYTFLKHPLPEQTGIPGGLGNNVFMVGDHYAMIFINNGNFVGSFDFEQWDYAEFFNHMTQGNI